MENLISIGNTYAIDVEKYNKLSVDDVFNSQSHLIREIIVPQITGKLDTAQKGFKDFILKNCIAVKNQTGRKIVITSIQSIENVKQTSETLNNQKKRQSYIANRKYLLDYVLFSNADNPIYLTTCEIVKKARIFQSFYYEFFDIHYDSDYSNDNEVRKLNAFASKHGLDKYHLVDIMNNKLNDILYDIFGKENIYKWANDKEITVDRVLYQDNAELNVIDTEYYEKNYFQPLRDRNVPAKSITRLANKKYIEDNKIDPDTHGYFYYTYKFVKQNENSVNDYKDLAYHQTEINKKIIERLEKTVVNEHSNNYKIRMETLKYIIENISLAID